MSIKLGTTDLSKVFIGTTEVKKIYQGTTEVWSASNDIVCNPDSISVIAGSMPYVTVNVDCDRAGTIYFENNGTVDYYELEWYKNNVYQGYLIVWENGDYALGPTSINVAAGDDIKFRVGTGSSASWRGLMTDASGNEIFTASVEA